MATFTLTGDNLMPAIARNASSSSTSGPGGADRAALEHVVTSVGSLAMAEVPAPIAAAGK